jgi:uncharacterized membrane protein YukC
MNTPLSSGKKKEYIKMPELMMRLFSIGGVNQKVGSWMKKLQERQARKDAERDEAERSSPISLSTHSGSTEEDEEAPTDKKRRDKEKVLKKEE